MCLALALGHHLAISNNVPLDSLAKFFKRLAPHLIIEFVPKGDSQVKRLLSSRKDVFKDYTQEGFERAFGTVGRIVASRPIPSSERILYLIAF